MRRVTLLGLTAAVMVAAGGASVYTLRASGATACPDREDLLPPIMSFEQAPNYYVTLTLTNPNPCYGFLDEPVDISFFGPHGRRAISYFQVADGTGPVHGDVGVCCTVTLPPRGSWTMRFGNEINNQGRRQVRLCGVRVEPRRSEGLDVWKRMPEGGAITGKGYFPPGWKDTAKPLTVDPSWRDPCGSPPATAAP